MHREADRNPRRALGKGISALLGPRPAAIVPAEQDAREQHVPEQDVQESLAAGAERLEYIPLEQIRANEEQPRESFDGERLEELARSIEAHGVLQPITVRKEENGSYTIVAGERRCRAARLAGLKEIPAIVRTVEQDQMLELALIENLQREDLNAVETATAFQRLASEHGLSHEEIANRTGKDRSTITNFLRLLKLSPPVLNELTRGTITVGHARALLNIPDATAQMSACNKIVANQLSVRDTERLVKNLTARAEVPQAVEKKDGHEDPNVRAAIEEMSRALGTRVRLIPRSGSRGRIEIEYYSKDDLDRIYAAIVRE